MKAITVVFQMLFFFCVLAQTGCEQQQLNTEPQPKTDKAHNVFESSNIAYSPVKVEVTPLTEIISTAGAEGASEGSRAMGFRINVYVSLLDSFGCQIKSPGVFRFEIYEHVQRSAEPKGRRIAIWPDTDLIDAVENNKYWRDFLRAYQFNLPLESADSQSYILQVTFMCPTGKRLTGEFVLKRTK
jgi:hypothetical protein